MSIDTSIVEEMGRADNTNVQVVWMIVISIIIAGLILRIIMAVIEATSVGIEDCVDEEHREEYIRTQYYWLTTLIVVLVCIFLIILFYEGYVIYHLKHGHKDLIRNDGMIVSLTQA